MHFSSVFFTTGGNNLMHLFVRLLGLFLCFVAFGCASAPEVKEPPVFYPPPPDLPRIQFLTSLSSGNDIEPDRSGFERFVTGAKEKLRRLDKPYGIASTKGKIYVCDTNATVMVFDLENKKYGSLAGAQGLGVLTQPLNISIDGAGNKYVSDPIRGQVVMFDRNDFYVRAFGTPDWWKPVNAAAFEDMLYVADARNGEIKVVEIQSDVLVRSIGKQPGEMGALAMPTNLTFDREGYLYASDAGRFQVLKLDRDGNIRRVTGKVGKKPGFFARPRGVATDHEGRLYVVDAAFDNVQVFNSDGSLLMYFSQAGKKGGDLYLPAQVAIDYENVPYFQKYADPNFEIEYLILVTSQFGDRFVNVFGFGRERGRDYLSDDAIKQELNVKIRKLEAEDKAKKGNQNDQEKSE